MLKDNLESQIEILLVQLKTVNHRECLQVMFRNFLPLGDEVMTVITQILIFWKNLKDL